MTQGNKIIKRWLGEYEKKQEPKRLKEIFDEKYRGKLYKIRADYGGYSMLLGFDPATHSVAQKGYENANLPTYYTIEVQKKHQIAIDELVLTTGKILVRQLAKFAIVDYLQILYQDQIGYLSRYDLIGPLKNENGQVKLVTD